jgi:hypothetical protein
MLLRIGFPCLNLLQQLPMPLSSPPGVHNCKDLFQRVFGALPQSSCRPLLNESSLGILIIPALGGVYHERHMHPILVDQIIDSNSSNRSL